MFKVNNNRLTVFASDVEVEDGTHSVYVDDSGVISSSGNIVCTYTSTNGKIISITSMLEKKALGSGKLLFKGRTANSGNFISRAPLFGGDVMNNGNLGMLRTKREGFAFAYSYNNIAYIAMEINVYRFIGGRVCFSGYASSITGVNNNALNVTASPFVRCGVQYPFGFGANLAAHAAGVSMTNPVANWVANAYSSAIGWRSANKYLHAMRGYKGIFRCQAGSKELIGGDAPPII